MARRYSERAKRNSRLGIDLRISVIKTRLAELKKEYNTYEKYLNRGLNDRWIRRVLTSLKKKIRTRTVQLRVYQVRRARLKREGKI